LASRQHGLCWKHLSEVRSKLHPRENIVPCKFYVLSGCGCNWRWGHR